MSGSLSSFYHYCMIVLRNKQFAFANWKAMTSGVNKAGQQLTAGQRAKAGLKSVGSMAGYGLGATAVGAGIAGGIAANQAKKALTGEMGEENGAGY